MRGDSVRFKFARTAVTAAVLLASAAFAPVHSETDAPAGHASGMRKVSLSPDTKSPPDPVAAGELTITHATGLTRPLTHGITAEVRAILARLSLVQRRKFERASADFPVFCQDWERKLHDREVDNLAHINWQKRGDYHTATYVAYSRIESCETKESDKGVPIGKLSYEEYNYYLVGKTIDEAKHAAPKLVSRTNTLKIFSWEKNRWFY